MTEQVDCESELKKAPYDVTLPHATAARAETEASAPATSRRKLFSYLDDINLLIRRLEEELAPILLPDSTCSEDSPLGSPESILTARLRLILESIVRLINRIDL